MAREPTGSVKVIVLRDGTRAFHLRFSVNGSRERMTLHGRPGCICGCGGGWAETSARRELGNVMARVRLGIWERPQPEVPVEQPKRAPLFSKYSEGWLQAKVEGILGGKAIAESTESDYRWRLRCHLLPFFGHLPLDEIDGDLCLSFKAHLLREARELREALEAGADLRDRLGRRAVPLGPASIRKVLDALAAILDDAVEDGHIDHNPARRKRMRVSVPQPKRSFLEMDELAALLDAAGDQDVQLRTNEGHELGPTAAMVAHFHRQGLNPIQIAEQLERTKSTISFHLRKIGADVGRGYVGRRVVCEILGRSGVRASELCGMKMGHVRLHDPDNARFRIPDAKTETGIREVQMSPDLVAVVAEHLQRLRRAGKPTGPDDHLVPNLHGGRLNRQRVAEIVREAAKRASEQLIERRISPLPPKTTPHTLRRTYISIALLANNFDVKWVMGQVGHANSKMTMDVYAQLEQRVDRSHGVNFDRLLREAREGLEGPPPDDDE